MLKIYRSMDSTPFRCLSNSISRFIHLVTCRVSHTMPADKDYKFLVSLLKHLKPVIDDVTDQKPPQDEALSNECEELDIAVNEAREFLEKWSPRMSKMLCVLQSKPFALKIQISSVKLSCSLCRLFESSMSNSSLSYAQLCMQESHNLKIGQLSQHIEGILDSQKNGKVPGLEHLAEITESLNLRSSQELMNEHIALEKEKQKAEEGKKVKVDRDQISQALDLMSHIRDYMVKFEKFKSINGIPIPSYFRCPLSLELMSDPVIVASGQTYERASIQKWLDNGLVRCPKMGYELSHKNLIPNYTVKALIATWCVENKVELPSNPKTVFTDKDDLQCPLERGNSASTSSLKVGDSIETQKINEESYKIFQRETEKSDQSSSPEHSYVHSRSESASSVVSSIDYIPILINNASDKSGDMKPSSSPFTPLRKISVASSSFSKSTVANGNHHPSRTPFSPSDSDELTSISHVEKLVDTLKNGSSEAQTAAAEELRFLAKHNTENRHVIGRSGAISPLISLLHSDVAPTQENAVTALLNLSIDESIKIRIAEEGVLEPIIHVLRTGNSGAKENAAATIFSISLIEEYRVKIGRSGAVRALVELLGSGTVRGKKDAATALFNLSIFHENKARIVQAGAVKYLVGLMDPESELVDKAVALLANLSTIMDGCSAIAREGGIPLLVEIVETGSQRGKENAASVLLQLCVNSPKYCRSVLQEGAVPPLVALSQSGTTRAKEKAQQLLSHFRNQRESAVARGRS